MTLTPAALPLQLETPVDAAEIFERGANLVGGNVEADADRDGGGGVQDIVRAGNVQGEIRRDLWRGSAPRKWLQRNDVRRRCCSVARAAIRKSEPRRMP